MARKSTASKKPLAQRTFKLPANLVAAFDLLCEAFDADPHRVARRFFEDGIRRHALGMPPVLEALGPEVRSPFEAIPTTYTYQPPAPNTPSYETMPYTMTYQTYERAPLDDDRDLMLPQSTGSSLSRGTDV